MNTTKGFSYNCSLSPGNIVTLLTSENQGIKYMSYWGRTVFIEHSTSHYRAIATVKGNHSRAGVSTMAANILNKQGHGRYPGTEVNQCFTFLPPLLVFLSLGNFSPSSLMASAFRFIPARGSIPLILTIEESPIFPFPSFCTNCWTCPSTDDQSIPSLIANL